MYRTPMLLSELRSRVFDTASLVPPHRTMLLSELLILLLSANGVASTWGNSTMLTVYRVTPIGVPGLTNMDTADAAGDVYFGLFQLALPLLCAQPGVATNMGWCTNRKWLSGGRHMMVYRQFKLEARLPLGIYARCNPDESSGTFSCCSSRQPRCGSPGFVPPAPGECDDCCWWQPPTRSSGGSPYESPPALNVTFAPYCDRARCDCPAIDTLSVGWEPHAMCNKPMAAEFHRRAARHAAIKAERQSDAIGGLLLHEQPTPSYWSCNGAVSDKCGGWTAYEDPGCRQCAATHLAQGDPRFEGSCNLALIDKVCTPPALACARTIRKDCGAAVGNGNCSRGNATQCKLCENCAFGGEARTALIAANCSFDVLFGTCGDAHHGQPIMFQYVAFLDPVYSPLLWTEFAESKASLTSLPSQRLILLLIGTMDVVVLTH
jgi:hypothetical protein